MFNQTDQPRRDGKARLEFRKAGEASSPSIIRSHIFLMPQSVPCPHCTIAVTVLELVHRGDDNIVTCRRGHKFPVSQVAQYFGRIESVGTPAEVDAQVRDILDRQIAGPPPPAVTLPARWPILVLAVAGLGVAVGVALGLALSYLLLHS